MRTRTLAASLIGLICCWASAQGPVVVVCATEFRDSIKPWVDYREGQGFRCLMIESQPSAKETHAAIVQAAASGPDVPSAVVLFGDCTIRGPGSPVDPQRSVPTFHMPSPVTASLGSTKTLATDTLFGDVDADGQIDIPVGRIPIDRNDQIDPYLTRIRQYEAAGDYGPWRHKIDLTAGIGGFGPLVDTAIEAVARGVITSRLPPTVQTRVTYASPSSPFFPGYGEFQSTVIGNFNSGGLFWVYAGHGQVEALDRVPPTRTGQAILDQQTVPRLRRPPGRAPIALLLACYTGAFDAKNDCIAEQMLLEPGGPIAVVAGTRMTLPYGNAVVATSMIDAWFKSTPKTLGESWLRTISTVADPGDRPPGMIDTMAAMMSPTGKQLPEERREHARLYNLLGDPLLRLVHPAKIKLEAPVSVEAGATVTVSGQSPMGGDVFVEVHRQLEPSPSDLVAQSKIERYEVSTKTLIKQTVLESPKGKFTASIDLPDTVQRYVNIVVRAEGDNGYAIGHRRVFIATPKPPTPP